MDGKEATLASRAAVSVEVACEKLAYYINRVAKRPVKNVQVDMADMATFNAGLAAILSNPTGGL